MPPGHERNRQQRRQEEKKEKRFEQHVARTSPLASLAAIKPDKANKSALPRHRMIGYEGDALAWLCLASAKSWSWIMASFYCIVGRCHRLFETSKSLLKYCGLGRADGRRVEGNLQGTVENPTEKPNRRKKKKQKKTKKPQKQTARVMGAETKVTEADRPRQIPSDPENPSEVEPVTHELDQQTTLTRDADQTAFQKVESKEELRLRKQRKREIERLEKEAENLALRKTAEARKQDAAKRRAEMAKKRSDEVAARRRTEAVRHEEATARLQKWLDFDRESVSASSSTPSMNQNQGLEADGHTETCGITSSLTPNPAEVPNRLTDATFFYSSDANETPTESPTEPSSAEDLFFQRSHFEWAGEADELEIQQIANEFQKPQASELTFLAPDTDFADDESEEKLEVEDSSADSFVGHSSLNFCSIEHPARLSNLGGEQPIVEFVKGNLEIRRRARSH